MSDTREIEWLPFQTMDRTVEIQVAAHASIWRHRKLSDEGQPVSDWIEGKPK